MPFKILYVLSDLTYLLGYKLFGYRDDLVNKNMSLAFPEKSIEEIKVLEVQFYHNFFDIIFEGIKLLTISKEEIRSRMREGNMKPLIDFKNKNQSVVLAIGHIGNWELGAAGYAIGNYPYVKGVYKPQSNRFFDELMIDFIHDHFKIIS